MRRRKSKRWPNGKELSDCGKCQVITTVGSCLTWRTLKDRCWINFCDFEANEKTVTTVENQNLLFLYLFFVAFSGFEKMFWLQKFEDTVRIQPKDQSRPRYELIKFELNNKLSNKVIYFWGWDLIFRVSQSFKGQGNSREVAA